MNGIESDRFINIKENTEVNAERIKKVSFKSIVWEAEHLALDSIELKCYKCTAKIKNMAVFPIINRQPSDKEFIPGECVSNAVFVNHYKQPSLICMKNGTAIANYGDGCICKTGHYRDRINAFVCIISFYFIFKYSLD